MAYLGIAFLTNSSRFGDHVLMGLIVFLQDVDLEICDKSRP